MVKLLVAPTLLMYTTRPAVVFAVGVGNVKVNPAAVAVMLKLLATSTVAVLAPIAALLPSDSGIAVNTVLEAFVNVEPVATVSPRLDTSGPATDVVTPDLPMVIADAVPVPILNVPDGVSIRGACRLVAALPVPLIQKLEVA